MYSKKSSKKSPQEEIMYMCERCHKCCYSYVEVYFHGNKKCCDLVENKMERNYRQNWILSLKCSIVPIVSLNIEHMRNVTFTPSDCVRARKKY